MRDEINEDVQPDVLSKLTFYAINTNLCYSIDLDQIKTFSDSSYSL